MASLIGHVGRSSAKLRLVKLKDNLEDSKEVFVACYATAKFPSLDQLVRHFMSDARKHHLATAQRDAPRRAPVTLNDLCLSFSAEEETLQPASAETLRNAFNLRLAFVVDATQSFSLHRFRPEELTLLNPLSSFESEGHQLVVHIDDRVKACLLLRHADGFREALPVEGGYLSIPIMSARDFRFQRFCRERLRFEPNRFLESSSVITAEGFALMHEFVCAEAGREPRGQNAAELLRAYPDPLVRETIAYYVEQLLSATFNIVVATLPTGGVFFVSDFLAQLLRCIGKDREQFFGDVIARLILSEHMVEKFRCTPVGVTGFAEESCIRGCAELLNQAYSIQKVPD